MDGFTPIRIGIWDHILAGKLCPFDLGIYLYMHLRADWKTGIFEGCALTIAHHFADPSLKHHINKCLIRLRDRRYINYRKGDGRRGAYPILIHKYEVRVGELSGYRLNAWNHGGLAKPEYERWNGRGTVEEQSGNSRGTVEEPIQEVLQEILQEVNQEVFQEESVGANAPLRPREKRACQMPDSFQPKESHQQLAAELGIDLRSAFEKFTDHHLSKGSRFKDWDRALNTWLRNEVRFAKPPKPNGKHVDLGKQDYTKGLVRQPGGTYRF